MVAASNFTKVTFKDFKFWIRINPGYQDIKCINEVIYDDPYDLTNLKTLIDPEVVFDIGGHVGSFGVLARAIWPKCYLVAFEPMRDSHELYIRNLKENGLWDVNQCMIYNRPIGYSKEKQCFVHASRSTGGHVFLPQSWAERYLQIGYRYYDRAIPDNEANLNPITIEDAFRQLDIQRVDLAKWDCEGGEIEAFEKMEQWAADRFRYMVGEFHMGKKIDYMKYFPRESESFWRAARKKFPHMFWWHDGTTGGLFKTYPKD